MQNRTLAPRRTRIGYKRIIINRTTQSLIRTHIHARMHAIE